MEALITVIGLTIKRMAKEHFNIQMEKNTRGSGVMTIRMGKVFFKRTSIGTYSYADGGKYQGEWRDNKRNGKGKFIDHDNNEYNGDWKDDKRQGIGVMRYCNGETFSGEWQNDCRNGKGSYKYSNGDRYKGEYRNDRRQGRGKLIVRNYRDIYLCEWE